HARYELHHDEGDLTRAIEVQEEALGLAPQGHPRRLGELHQLGSYLHTRYELHHDEGDLTRAIEVQEEALGLAPLGHPRRLDELHQLGSYLHTRYELHHDEADLARAIEVQEEALGLAPQGHPRRLGELHQLGFYLHARYELHHDEGDLTRAIELQEEALGLAPQGHPRRLGELHALGILLHTRYKLHHDEADLTRAGEALVLAVSQQESELGRIEGEESALGFIRGKEDLYEFAISVFLELVDRARSQGEVNEQRRWMSQAWKAGEAGTARLLAGVITTERAILEGDDNEEITALLDRLDTLGKELANIERRLDPGPSSTMHSMGRFDAFGGTSIGWDTPLEKESRKYDLEQYEQLSTERETKLIELRRLSPELASLRAIDTMAPEEVAKALSPGEHVVVLYPLSNTIALFVLDHNNKLSVHQVPLHSSDLHHYTRELTDSFTRDPYDPDELTNTLDYATSWLGGVLGPVLEQSLGLSTTESGSGSGSTAIIFVPHGPLASWPLHLLSFGGSSLWQRCAVAYAPTADTIVFCHNRIVEHTNKIVLAPKGDLPGAVYGAGVLGERTWTSFLGDQAGRDTLNDRAAHIAVSTHATWDMERVSASIALATGDIDGVELLRILPRSNNVEHIDLSICGGHDSLGKEGPYFQGLTRGVLACGARSLTNSLWPLDDIVACFFLIFLDEAYTRGYSRPQALQLAAKELLDLRWGGVADWLYERASHTKDPHLKRLGIALATEAACRAARVELRGNPDLDSLNNALTKMTEFAGELSTTADAIDNDDVSDYDRAVFIEGVTRRFIEDTNHATGLNSRVKKLQGYQLPLIYNIPVEIDPKDTATEICEVHVGPLLVVGVAHSYAKEEC
ncbi:MAG: CHAT domain-containing protein, partial [Ferrimicrobium sp.]